MNILAIETTMGQTSVAVRLRRDGAVIDLARHLPLGAPQAEGIVPLIAVLMEEAGLAFQSLDRIAVSIGPGGFSGIRTGVAAARGIGLAAGLPVVGATSFKIMAAKAAKHPFAGARIGLAAPAGQDMVFCQTVFASGTDASAIAALRLEDAGGFFSCEAGSVFGPAALLLRERGLISPLIAVYDMRPDATALLDLAPDLDPAIDVPVPFYVRPPDAKAQTGYAVERRVN